MKHWEGLDFVKIKLLLAIETRIWLNIWRENDLSQLSVASSTSIWFVKQKDFRGKVL